MAKILVVYVLLLCALTHYVAGAGKEDSDHFRLKKVNKLYEVFKSADGASRVVQKMEAELVEHDLSRDKRGIEFCKGIFLCYAVVYFGLLLLAAVSIIGLIYLFYILGGMRGGDQLPEAEDTHDLRSSTEAEEVIHSFEVSTTEQESDALIVNPEASGQLNLELNSESFSTVMEADEHDNGRLTSV